jgi:hypothetical protein
MQVASMINTEGIKLPAQVSIKENGLYWKGHYVFNFLPVVQDKVTEADGSESVRVVIRFSDGTESDLKTLPVSGLQDLDWFNIDQRCHISPDCPRSERYLASIIKFALPDAQLATQTRITQLGTSSVKGVHVYNAGGRLIRPPDMDSEIEVIVEPSQFNLAVGNYTERQAATGMMKVVNLGLYAGKVMLAHTLLYLMRALYVAAGVIPCCILFLVGLTGTKKTTLSAFITQLYDRDKGIARPTRLNTTIAAFEAILYEKNDCSIVLDDLFPADSGQTKRKQEQTLIELVRIIGDSSGKARMSGKQVVKGQPSCGVIVTGEYIIGSGSDAARLLPVSFTTPIDNRKLHESQREPLIMSTFYEYYIQWFITNYNNILDWLKAKLAEFRKVDIGVHPRLHETLFCLSTSYLLFLRYCNEKGLTPSARIQSEYRSFRDHLTSLVKEQDKRVKQSGDAKTDQTNYLELVRMIFNGKGFRLAKSIKPFGKKGPETHDGLIYDGCLCLRGTKLVEKARKYVPAASLNDIIEDLIAQDALKTGKERTIQIYGCGGKRFYAIPLKKLR